MQSKRKTIYIKKRFQAEFAVKFLVVIIVEALLAIGIFGYLSMDTVVMGYAGNEVVVARTRDYFLQTVLFGNLIIIGITAVIGFVMMLFVSHRLAGPLYRFEKSLDEISAGDLTHRFRLRKGDEMNSLGERLNEFNARMESVVGRMQRETGALDDIIAEMRSLAEAGHGNGAKMGVLATDAAERLASIKRAAGFFKTSKE